MLQNLTAEAQSDHWLRDAVLAAGLLPVMAQVISRAASCAATGAPSTDEEAAAAAELMLIAARAIPTLMNVAIGEPAVKVCKHACTAGRPVGRSRPPRPQPVSRDQRAPLISTAACRTSC